LSTGGFTWGRLKQARAQQRTVAAQAEQLKLDAAREVAQARSAERHLTSALEATHEQAKAARTAFEESKARYAAGLSEYLPVITALVTAQRAELTVITAERDLIVARIQLYTALGGGT
jgi:outer membrane protein TolC